MGGRIILPARPVERIPWAIADLGLRIADFRLLLSAFSLRWKGQWRLSAESRYDLRLFLIRNTFARAQVCPVSFAGICRPIGRKIALESGW
jgi:hypothetical protein